LIRTILFDVDGVLLSEERYFDASALTVWELLNSKNYLGLDPEKFKTDNSDEEIKSIREQVFDNDQVLKLLKSKGLNSNWDMIYLTFSYQIIHLLSQINNTEHSRIKKWLENEIDMKTLGEMKNVLRNYSVDIQFTSFIDDFQGLKQSKQELFIVLDRLAETKLGIKTTIFQEKGTLWSICEHTSQEWYVGDHNILSSTGNPSVQTGKKGFLSDEKTLGSPEEISELFRSLREAGISIGIGTGRPALETTQPFEILGWLKHFELNHIVTADDVLRAERKFTNIPSLAKPHPFTYLLALAGKNSMIDDAINAILPIKDSKEVLIVGDSLADLLAAQKIGCRFAAVLTGLSGKEAREEFKVHNAEFILDSVLDVKDLILL
jgi:phosphoglycolate phosphatase-like HAD superfamily hydrolase